MMKEGNQKLGLEEVMVLVDAVNEPVILEHFEQQVAIRVSFAGSSTYAQNDLTTAQIDEKTTVLLL